MKPMLACKAPEKLKFPLYASPKLDGIRAVILNNCVYGRSLKLIPNAFVQTILNNSVLNCLDGELTVGDAAHPNVMQITTSGIMTEAGEPDFTFWVFDYIPNDSDKRTYQERYESLQKFKRELEPFKVKILNQEIIKDQKKLDEYEKFCLDSGFEGVMLRSMDAPYKHGRSTAREGYLMKLKRFEDSEAVLIAIEEQLANNNVATVSALGYTERSSHQANMTPKNTMGSLQVKDIKTGIIFNIGTGFTSEQRQHIWDKREDFLKVETIVKYKHFAKGVKEAPRFPVFLSFRDKIDL